MPNDIPTKVEQNQTEYSSLKTRGTHMVLRLYLLVQKPSKGFSQGSKLHGQDGLRSKHKMFDCSKLGPDENRIPNFPLHTQKIKNKDRAKSSPSHYQHPQKRLDLALHLQLEKQQT